MPTNLQPVITASAAAHDEDTQIRSLNLPSGQQGVMEGLRSLRGSKTSSEKAS
jgi:hypothetical protein